MVVKKRQKKGVRDRVIKGRSSREREGHRKIKRENVKIGEIENREREEGKEMKRQRNSESE